MPKYSIVLPVYNAEKYIKAAIDSVLNQSYQDFEFIISNNCSTDGTSDILNSIDDNRVKIVKTEKTLPLGAHWDFALKYAAGEWIWALGADDAMMPYFFELCDKLVEICERKKLKIIKSNRAYYFWPGFEDVFGDKQINLNLSTSTRVRKTHKIMKDMLTGKVGYCDVPQMYVSSLFKKSLLDEARLLSKTADIIPFESPNQDSYLGVLACELEEKYLDINIPLGWIGTSPASLERKIEKKQIFYDDCNFSQLCIKIKSLLYIMHLAFRVFETNSNLRSKKFNRYLKYTTILSRAYYNDLINLKKDDSRVEAFFDYLKSIHIDSKTIIRNAHKIKCRDQLRGLLSRFSNNKIIRLLQRILKFALHRKEMDWSIILSNKTFIPYKQINALIESENHIREILDSVIV